MAAGAPVVASDSGGLAQVVQHERTGLLLPAGDVDAWTAALDHLWGNPELAVEMGLEARRQVAAGYSRESYVPRLTAMLERLRQDRAGAVSA
jgi:1,4-alpha-glucan branching enzyme